MKDLPVEIANFFLAMQLGKSGATALQETFLPNAVYEEPFTGEPRQHTGIDAIMAAMAMGWEMPMEDTRIEVTRVAVDGGQVHVNWTCHSPSLPGGKGSGLNRFTLEDGKIAHLITTLDGPTS